MKYDFSEHIATILDSFDFEKVHKVMEMLNWTWHNKKTVPTVQELRGAARDLLEDLANNYKPESQESYMATGGFHASISSYNEELPHLNLMFYVDWKSIPL